MSDPVLEVKNLNAYYYGSGILGKKMAISITKVLEPVGQEEELT